MNKSKSFVTLYQEGKSFEAVGKSMQDSPNLILNTDQHKICQIIRVHEIGVQIFQKVEIAKFLMSDF